MSERSTVLRSVRDIGLAGGSGGSLTGAARLDGAAGQAPRPAERLQIASAGWDRRAPVSLAAIGAHLAGAAGILVLEAARAATREGAGVMSAVKAALTAAASGAAACSALAGKKMGKAGGAPAEGITGSAASAPGDVSAAHRQQRVAQRMIPVFTGALLVVSSLAGEQQKPAAAPPPPCQRRTRYRPAAAASRARALATLPETLSAWPTPTWRAAARHRRDLRGPRRPCRPRAPVRGRRRDARPKSNACGHRRMQVRRFRCVPWSLAGRAWWPVCRGVISLACPGWQRSGWSRAARCRLRGCRSEPRAAGCRPAPSR